MLRISFKKTALLSMITMFFFNIDPAHSTYNNNAASSNKMEKKEVMVKKIDEYTGFTHEPFKYESNQDANQTLGHIKNEAANGGSREYFDPYGDRKRLAEKAAKKMKAKKAQVKKQNKKNIEPAVKASAVPSVEEKNLPATAQEKDATEVNKNPQQQVEVENNDAQKAEAPANLETPPSMQQQQAAVPQNETLTIGFDNESVDIDTEGVQKLSELANKLNQDDKLFVKITSYVPASDNLSNTKRKSLQRAIKARKKLMEFGVSPVKISVNSSYDTENTESKLELLVENLS